MAVLAIIDLLWGFIILIAQIRIITRIRRIRIFNFSNLMFAFVYGFLPAIILFRNIYGNSTYEIDTSDKGIVSLAVATALSVVVHLCMNLAYNGTKARKKIAEVSDDVAISSGFVMLVIGWLSLIIWTRADGGIFNFITHADGIRAGYYQLNNPFAFLEHITRILLFAGCLLFSAWMQQQDLIRKIKLFIPAIAGLIGAFLFISAWDSRAAFGFFFLMIILVHIEYRVSIKQKVARTEFIKLAVILVAILILMVGSQTIMNSFRVGAYVSAGRSLNVFDIIETEFGFVLKTQQAVIGNVMHGTTSLQIFNDVINALFAWVPSRFIPFELPQTLWRYNTLLVSGTTIHGTVPSDILSSSISDLWLVGIIIIPFFYGRFLKRLDTFFYSENYSLYNSVIKCSFCTIALNQISHFSIEGIVAGMFYIVIGHLITLFVGKVKTRNIKSVSYSRSSM